MVIACFTVLLGDAEGNDGNSSLRTARPGFESSSRAVVVAPGSTQWLACSCQASTAGCPARPARTPGSVFAGRRRKTRTLLLGADWGQTSSCTVFQLRSGIRHHDGSVALRQKCEPPTNRCRGNKTRSRLLVEALTKLLIICFIHLRILYLFS